MHTKQKLTNFVKFAQSCTFKSSTYFKRVSTNLEFVAYYCCRQCENCLDTLDGRADSFCFSESVEETQKSSSEVANESARVC